MQPLARPPRFNSSLLAAGELRATAQVDKTLPFSFRPAFYSDVFVGWGFDPSLLDDIRPYARRCKTFCYGSPFIGSPMVEALAPLFDNGNGDHERESAAAWERVFRASPRLEELFLFRDCRAARDVTDVFRGLHAASSTCLGDAGCTVATFACPGLRDVCVQGTSTVEAYEATRECFRYRADRGFILESLNLVSLVGWAEVPSPLRRGFAKDVSAAVKAIRTARDMREWEWGGEHGADLENESADDSDDGLVFAV